MICLDTNAVIGILHNRPSSFRDRVADAKKARTEIAVSTIVLFELRFGADRSARPAENHERIRAFLAGPIQVLPFDDDDAIEAGKLRAILKAAGTPIGPYDLLIAAQARRRKVPIVTANASEFDRVPGLKRLDWSA